MKIGFIFTDKPDLAQTRGDERYYSYFELPDAVESLPDIQAQIITIGELVAQFNNASLHVSCPDIGLKNHPIKQLDEPTNPGRGLFFQSNATCLYFSPDGKKYWQKRTLKIYSPLSVTFPRWGSADKGYRDLKHKPQDPILAEYTERVQVLSDRLIALLNTDSDWRFGGFHPYLWQNSLVSIHNQRSRKWRAEDRKRTREAEKRKAREAKLAEKLAANPPQPLTHGAGRTVGARPGIYNGVQMRSQLEIRFASELDERGIKWVYEGEALGESGYLVDFYLPDLSGWVEVKGRFEPRDRQVLPTVAKYLKTEHKHRLLVYTSSGTCYVVNPSGFRAVERKNFWGELLR
ncbi:MAG: hypothetical protein IT319_15840 [Anaerolineae bacterium]|nr:hypothetical protein [Anaerolineae bacterium]